jgi:hypothetical protein
LKWLLFVLIILLFLFVLIILTRVSVFFNYHHKKDDDHLQIEFRAWFGLIRYKRVFPLVKVDEESSSIILKGEKELGGETTEKDVTKITADDILQRYRNVKELAERVFNLVIIVKKFFNKVSVKKFEWYSMIGVGDAPNTGIATGALWVIKGSIIGVISRYFNMKSTPKVMIHPNFQQFITETKISCMFQFRIGNAILAGIKLVKFWKGSQPNFNSQDQTKSKSV